MKRIRVCGGLTEFPLVVVIRGSIFFRLIRKPDPTFQARLFALKVIGTFDTNSHLAEKDSSLIDLGKLSATSEASRGRGRVDALEPRASEASLGTAIVRGVCCVPCSFHLCPILTSP